MLTKKERQEFFRDIIPRYREEIIKKWVAKMRLHEEDADTSEKELVEKASFALKAVQTHLCDNDTTLCNEFVKRGSKQKMTTGQPIAAILNSTEGFRVAMTPIIIKEMESENLECLFADINRVTSYGQKGFIDSYRALAEGAIHQKVEELNQAVEVRDNFLMNVSHEFRTPLTIIQGFSKMLESGKVKPDDAPELAEKIYIAGETLLKMVSDMILLAKLRGNTVKAGNTHIYVKELTETAQKEAIGMAPANTHIWEMHSVDEDLMVIGDYEMLKVMLRHILSNAIKFSPKDSRITVATRVDRTLIHVDIADEGVGVEKDDIDFIFENFSQKESHASRKYEGAGIGLYLARQIAHLHGGDVTVVKRDGTAGSVFTISLPLAEKPAAS